MAENVTTLLDKMDAANISLADFLYLVQGTGANRDRKASLEQIRDFIQAVFTNIVISGQQARTKITNGGAEVEGSSGKTVIYQNLLKTQATGESGVFSVEVEAAGITINFENGQKIKVGSFEGAAGISFIDDDGVTEYYFKKNGGIKVNVFTADGNATFNGDLKLQNGAKIIGQITAQNRAVFNDDLIAGDDFRSDKLADFQGDVKMKMATRTTLDQTVASLLGDGALGYIGYIKNGTGQDLNNGAGLIVPAGDIMQYMHDGTSWHLVF